MICILKYDAMLVNDILKGFDVYVMIKQVDVLQFAKI